MAGKYSEDRVEFDEGARVHELGDTDKDRLITLYMTGIDTRHGGVTCTGGSGHIESSFDTQKRADMAIPDPTPLYGDGDEPWRPASEAPENRWVRGYFPDDPFCKVWTVFNSRMGWHGDHHTSLYGTEKPTPPTHFKPIERGPQ